MVGTVGLENAILGHSPEWAQTIGCMHAGEVEQGSRPVPDGFKIDGVLDELHWKGLDTLVLTRNNGPTGGKPNVDATLIPSRKPRFDKTPPKWCIWGAKSLSSHPFARYLSRNQRP